METEAEQEFDVVVIGAGPAGENAADRAARGGLRVAVVEDELVGGECSYWACIPSKALLRPVNLALATQRMRGLRPAEVDPPEVLARRDYWDAGLVDAGQVSWLDSAGLTLVRGHGQLDGPRRVRVGDLRLLARVAVVLATGTTASLPPIPGLREAAPWTNREGTTSSRIPPRLVVLGGGVVACELAQAWQGLGSQVTLLERSERVLGRMEPFAADLVAAGLREQGVDVRTGVTVVHVERRSDGSVVVTVRAGNGGDEVTVEADEVLAALGRSPATGSLGLETVGIGPDQLAPGGYVPVDETCAVGAAGLDDQGQPWLYAVGDVNGRNLLTHMGKYQGRAVGERLAVRGAGRAGARVAPGGGRRGRHVAEDNPLVPWADEVGAPQVVFTDPEVASVGLTESAARRRGLTVRVVDVPMTSASGAGLQADGYRGQARMVVDEDRKVIVGMTFVGQDVAELVHSATIAVVAGVPLARLWHAVPPFPTMSEVWLRLLEAYGL
ncbi:MAG: dihydrolipoyl dehydrogenase family protein [Actinomycetes bacterium]